MLETIKDYKRKFGFEPNECELTRLTGYSRTTVRIKLKELEKSKQIKKIVVPARGHYELQPIEYINAIQERLEAKRRAEEERKQKELDKVANKKKKDKERVAKEKQQERIKRFSQRIKTPRSNIDPQILSAVVNKSGRERTREMVRIRDKYTCQMCGLVRTPDMAKEQSKRGLDVHHVNGICGKMSRAYDRVDSLDTMITLCHKCHFNMPDHTLHSSK